MKLLCLLLLVSGPAFLYAQTPPTPAAPALPAGSARYAAPTLCAARPADTLRTLASAAAKAPVPPAKPTSPVMPAYPVIPVPGKPFSINPSTGLPFSDLSLAGRMRDETRGRKQLTITGKGTVQIWRLFPDGMACVCPEGWASDRMPVAGSESADRMPNGYRSRTEPAAPGRFLWPE